MDILLIVLAIPIAVVLLLALTRVFTIPRDDDDWGAW